MVIVIDCISITRSHVILIPFSRFNVILIEYIVNVILISDYFHSFTRHFIIYHVISCQRCGLVYKGKDNNRTDLPIDGLLSYVYTWWFVSLLGSMKGRCVVKYCFRCCRYYKSYKQAFQISSCCVRMVKPKLVTQPAIMHVFLVLVLLFGQNPQAVA